MAFSDLDELDDIVTRLSDTIPKGLIDIKDESHYFRSENQVYFLDKAPVRSVFSIDGTVDGVSNFTFNDGVDYELIDDDGDGEDDSIDWSVGGNSPDDGTDFFVNYRAESVISRYVDAHDSDVDLMEDDINDIIASAQVDRADGGSLDEIGAIFGPIGKRRNRNDEQYRALIKSIVQSFQGRGTKPGMKFAIAAGIGTSTDNITITEDFNEVGYSISIDNVDTSFLTSTINDMAELADPSGVELIGEPFISLDGDTIYINSAEATVSQTTSGLGSGVLALDGTDTLPADTTAEATWDSATWNTDSW